MGVERKQTQKPSVFSISYVVNFSKQTNKQIFLSTGGRNSFITLQLIRKKYYGAIVIILR